MLHDTPLITTIVAGLGLAFIFGAIFHRLRIPPIAGYLLAGVLVGPHTPGYVADQHLAPELAEIGVILLMFGVGLHFSLRDLLSVRAIAIPGAVVQIAVATLLGMGLAHWLGWGMDAGVVFGLALSVASTVVLLRALQERRLVETERGRIAVGWLIVEDLAMVLALVLLPALASTGEATAAIPQGMAERIAQGLGFGVAGIVAVTLAKVAAFVVFMLVVGRRAIPWILHMTAHTGSRELFRLAVLVIALGVAFGAAELFGVSLALGAFFAGMILSESELSHRAAEESLPLRDAFAVLFFVSVGMLFDPMMLLSQPLTILAVLLIIVLGKSIAAFLIVRAFGYPTGTALTISASLAQIGEFSFILAELGVKLDILPEEGRALILAGAMLSILVNPLIFAGAERLRSRIERPVAPESSPKPGEPSAVEEMEDATPIDREGHTVLIGHGRVGSLVAAGLIARGDRPVVVETGDKALETLRAIEADVISGNAADPKVLALVSLPRARRLVVAIPDPFEAGQVVEQARLANPEIEIIARAHSDAGYDHLRNLGADEVIIGEREIARAMIDHITRPEVPPDPPPTI